jgi:chemotaxis-related protein WspD
MKSPGTEGNELAVVDPQAREASTGAALEVDDCWSRIGLAGDRTCPELRKFILCPRCPVYSKAGAQLLDRPLPPEYRLELTRRFAQPEKPAAPAKAAAIIFRVETEWLALPLRVFQEVAEPRTLHSLPRRRPGMVVGLANVRGQLLICISLARWLRLPNRAAAEAAGSEQRLLVANYDGSRYVFPVDEIQGVHRIQPEDLREPPATVAKSTSNYAQGLFLWQRQAVGLLDADKLFPDLNRSLL